MSDDKTTNVMSHRKEDRPDAFKQDQVAGSPHQWDETISRMVRAQCAAGIPSRAIVASVGLSWDTIKKHYKDEVSAGNGDVESRLSRRVLAIAEGEVYEKGEDGEDDTSKPIVPIKDSLAAAKFYLGTRFGWKETTRTELTGADGKPIEAVTSEMTPQQAAELYAKTRDGDTSSGGDE